MSAKQEQSSLLFTALFTVLFAWGYLKTAHWYGTSKGIYPISLAFFFIVGAASTIRLFFYKLDHYFLRREALGYSHRRGSASWASSQEIKHAGLYETDGIFLGCDQTGKPLFFEGETHGMTLSPAGKGKTISMAIPALCHSPLPMVVTDLKATLACMTKNLREDQHNQETFCVNPANLYQNILGKAARYNPLIIIIDDWKTKTGHKDLIADAQAIALQLCPEPPTQGENTYFRNGSRKLLVFGVIYLVTQKSEDQVNLGQLLRLLRNVSDLMDAFYVGSCSDALNGELADMANDWLKKFASNDKKQVESFREGALQGLEEFARSG